MGWLYLAAAGLLEIVWAVGLKYTDGFTRPWPTAGTLGAMVASVFLLALALREIPVGTGYAVWTGIGAVGTALFGMLVLGEPRTGLRLICLGLILAGIIGLKATAGHGTG
jgi:quaternary ammonium compound-resistance protein SugE